MNFGNFYPDSLGKWSKIGQAYSFHWSLIFDALGIQPTYNTTFCWIVNFQFGSFSFQHTLRSLSFEHSSNSMLDIHHGAGLSGVEGVTSWMLGERCRGFGWPEMVMKHTTHPDIAHLFGNPPATPTMKGTSAHVLLVQVARGVSQRCVETTLDLWNIEWNWETWAQTLMTFRVTDHFNRDPYNGLM